MEEQAVELPKPKFHEDHGPHGAHFSYYTADQMQDYARTAVLQERGRCAKIAASFATCPCNGDRGRCMENDPPLAIAAAIRKG